MDGHDIPNHTIKDDIPFQCLIEREDIKEGDKFNITEQNILCEVFAHEANFDGSDHSIAWKFVEKEIVKVCIEKVE